MNLLRGILLALVAVYRYGISPFLAPSCRYWPSCSSYAQEALTRHGAAKGSWLTVKRLLRCNPWGSWGYDPVPPLCDREERR